MAIHYTDLFQVEGILNQKMSFQKFLKIKNVRNVFCWDEKEDGTDGRSHRLTFSDWISISSKTITCYS